MSKDCKKGLCTCCHCNRCLYNEAGELKACSVKDQTCNCCDECRDICESWGNKNTNIMEIIDMKTGEVSLWDFSDAETITEK